MRALFVWEAPSPSLPPEPLTMREVMLLVDVDLGTFDDLPATLPLCEEIRAAKEKRDALIAWAPSPFVSQPDITVEGTAEGLAWGRCEVDERQSECLVRVAVEMPRVGEGPLTMPDAPLAMFRRHHFRGGPLGARALVVFVRDGLDVERVARALPEILR